MDVVCGDDFDSEGFHFVEQVDEDFFWEERAVECEAELDSALQKGFVGNELFECAHYPRWKEIHVDGERIPGVETRGWTVTEHGSDSG